MHHKDRSLSGYGANFGIVCIMASAIGLLGSLMIETSVYGQAQIDEPDNVGALETFGTRSPLPANPPKPGVPSLAERLDVVGELDVPEYRLGPVDRQALLAEDAERYEFGSRVGRGGINRDTWVQLGDGQWHDVPGGQLWTVDVVAEGAFGIRLGLIGVDLDPGGELVVYAPGDDQQPVHGPYANVGPLGDGEFWTPTSWGQRVRVEYFRPDLPDGVQPREAPFFISQIHHWYRDPFNIAQQLQLRGDGGGSETGSLFCMNDVACFPAWSDVADAVGLISWTAGGGGLCSGQLMNTTVEDLTPYFLTANHCINTASEASSAEIFWFFQNSTCNGVPGFVPTSSFTTIVDNACVADHSLLMVKGELPGNVFWVGWTTTSASPGTSVVGVHHPEGTKKRISFGTQQNVGTPCVGCGNFLDWLGIAWNDGVTAPGSSGSGIYRESTQQLYGVLTCGASSCSNQNGLDFYGMMNQAIQSNATDIDVFLIEGSDDEFEDNGDCADAAALDAGTYSDLIVKSVNEDWYSFVIPSGSEATVMLDFNDSWGDIDMQLYDACGGELITQSISNTNDEQFTHQNLDVTQAFFLRVFLDSDTRNEYDLDLDISGPQPPSNDDCTSPIPVSDGGTVFTTLAATTDGPDQVGSDCDVDGDSQIHNDVWFRYQATCDGTATIDVCDANYDSKIGVYGGTCPDGPSDLVACNDDACGAQSSVSVPVQQGSFMYIRVGGAAGDTGSGTLTINCEEGPVCPADVAGDDNVVNVSDLLSLLSAWGPCDGCPEDINGSGAVDISDLLELLSAWGPCE